jgi:hypothetical protein
MGWGSGEPGGRLLGGGVTGGRRQGMLCVVFRERVIYNGCIMGSGVDIFEGDWKGWV